MATNSNRGFGAMDSGKQRDAARKGGKASSSNNIEGMDRSEAGKLGAAAQSKEAKAKGGRSSHGGSRN